MSNLSEEENKIEDKIWKIIIKIRTGQEVSINDDTTISNLLDLYNKEKEKNQQKENKIKNKIKFYEGLKNLNKNESIYSVEELKYSEIVDLLKDLLKEN